MTMSTRTKCKCGCGGDAVWLVTGFDFDPQAPGGKGPPFSEAVCTGTADYLTEASAECGFPCTKTAIVGGAS